MVTATARPKRIAFLVDPDNPAAESLVDAMVQHGIERWGGAYYPIVATDGTNVSADSWRVLDAVDPDVVCAVTPIANDLCKKIAHLVSPGAIERLDDRQREHLGPWIGSQTMSALDTDDIPRYLVTAQPWGIPHRFLYLKDTVTPNPTVRSFALRNFGLLRETISTKQAFEGLPVEGIALEKTDVGALLDSFVQFHGRTTTPKDISLFSATRPYSPEYDQFAQGFHLVVGDSVRDLLYAWNRKLMSEGWIGRDVLWLPTSLADDPTLLALVGKWIAHEYLNNQDRRGFVLSYSADEALLQRVATAVGKTAWMHFGTMLLPPDRFPFPETRAAWYGVFRDGPPRRTAQIPLVNDAGLLSFPVPYFLTSRRGQGDGWMVDLDIEYHLDPPRYSNRSDSWRLPKRPALGREFAESTGLARIVNGGLPSVEVKRGDQHIRLRIPSKRTVLHALLQPPHTDTPGAPAKARFSYFETSEQGRRLAGIIGLFGSLDHAGRTFDDAYWRSVFLQLAGVAPNQSKSQVTRVERLLEEVAQGPGLGTPEARKTLANRIVAQIAYFSSATPSMAAGEFRQRFYEMRSQDREHTDIAEGEAFEHVKAREVEAFLEGGILVQGVSLSCPRCGKEEWRITDALSSEIRCDGCLQTFAFPPSPQWRFRLNGLIMNGITKAGVLAVLHTLLQQGQFARDLFFYLPCQSLYEDYEGDPYTDLDLMAIKDGKVIIGEVKSSPEAFREKDFVKLRSVADEIRPDVLVLAATGSDWPAEVIGAAEELRQSLGLSGVAVETLLLTW